MKHGIYISEVSTSVVPSVTTESGIPVVFGTAPINLSSDPTAVTNVPILCETYAEAVDALGYSSDWTDYTLCEAIYAFFELFAVEPVIFVNVLDPTEHITAVSDSAVTLSAGTVTVEVAGILLSSLEVQLTTAGQALTLNTDYTAAFDDDGYLVLSYISGGAVTSTSEGLVVSYTKLNPAAVTSTTMIGGVNATTGAIQDCRCSAKCFRFCGWFPAKFLRRIGPPFPLSPR